MSFTTKLLLLFLIFSLPLSAQNWTGILDPNRATDWSNAGIAGGIPSGTWTQCGATIAAYGTNGSPAAPTTIINALNHTGTGYTLCGANTYVLLGSGNFHLNANIRSRGVSNSVLRGGGADTTHIFIHSTTTCSAGASTCLASFEDTAGEFPTGIGTAVTTSWTAGFTKSGTSITVANAAKLSITANSTILVLDQCDDGYSGATTGTNATCASGSAVDTGGYFNCGAAYVPAGPTGCSYNSWDGSAARAKRFQEEFVTVTGCSPSCGNAGSTVLTINPPLIHPNWASARTPEVWPIQAGTCSKVGFENFHIDGAGTTGQFGVNFTNCLNFWTKGLSVTNAASAGITVYTSLFGDVESNYVYNAGQSVQGTDPNSKDPSGIDINAGSSLVANNIVQWSRIGIIGNGPYSGNAIVGNFIVNAFESNGDLWGACWDGHSNGADYNLWEHNVCAQVYMDQTHGSKLMETYYRNLVMGWESCSNGQCTPSASQKNANVYAIGDLSSNRYENFVANVLGTPGITTNAYVYTNASQFVSNTTGYVYNWGSGNQSVGIGGPIPIDNIVLSTSMRWGNYDAFNSATLECTAASTPIAACTGDERAISAPTYPGLSSPAMTFPASFIFNSRPSWWSASVPFPAIGPDVTGGNVGQCGGTVNTAGQYALVPATNASQCASQGLNTAWAGHVNAIPAMKCFLETMGGVPDGTGSALTFNAATCYGSSPMPPSAPTGLSVKSVM